MNTQTNTFIPHDNTKKTGSNRLGNFLLFFTIIIFIVAIIFAFLSYVLRQKEEKQIATYEEALNNSQQRFASGLSINTFKQLDTRLSASRELLGKHKSFKGLFSLVEQLTLEQVQFTSLSYSSIDNTQSNLVKLIGKAPDYKTIAEQSEQFSKNEEAKRYITNVVFSNLSLAKEGRNDIVFEVSFQVDPEFLSYNRYLDLSSKNTVIEIPEETNTTSSSRINSPNIKNQ